MMNMKKTRVYKNINIAQSKHYTTILNREKRA